MTPTEMTAHFFLALAAILLGCRLLQVLTSRLGQPSVVAEMVGGILLGPSLLGALCPGVEHALFPAELRPVLYVVGQIGLVALMFGVGCGLRQHLGGALAGRASIISLAALICPLILGIGLTYAVHGHVPIFRSGVSVFVTAALVGVLLAITAFPMLARIIVDHGISDTRHGSVSLAAGALDDLLAWLLLAGVLSFKVGHSWLITKAIGGAVILAIVLVFVVRPMFARLLGRTGSATLAILAVLFGAAWFTENIGLYAVFGAFSVGAALPAMPAAVTVDVDTMMSNLAKLFVPIFFTYSGLNTRFSTFQDQRVLAFAIAAVVLAVLGKFGACYLVARRCGESAATAARIGTLMNTRGLMQLIALNIGVQAGIVSPALFTSIVLAALTTTAMTGPLLRWLDRRDGRIADTLAGAAEHGLLPAG